VKTLLPILGPVPPPSAKIIPFSQRPSRGPTISNLDEPDRKPVSVAPSSRSSGSSRLRIAPNDGSIAELKFTYEGPGEAVDGEAIRRDVGVKLSLDAGAAVAYVVWRIEPDPMILVATRIEGDRSRGYEPVPPAFTLSLPDIAAGESHVLGASLDRGHIVVRVDGRTVWIGKPAVTSLSLQGPIGVRARNGAFKLSLPGQRDTLPAGRDSKGPF
jgi:hypothetical protein